MTPYSFVTNSDDIFFRALYVAVLNVLNEKISYDVILSNGTSKNVKIPFYFSLTGDGRFLQDTFLTNDDCQIDFKVDGNYDVVPRGVVKFLSDISIDETSLTTNHVRLEYQEENNGKMETYSGKGIVLPLRCKMEVKMIFNIILDFFRCLEVSLSEFFRTIQFSFRYKQIRIPCRIIFPLVPLANSEKSYSWSFSEDQNIISNFFIEIETYFPIIDKNTKFFKGNIIENFLSQNMVEGGEFEGEGEYNNINLKEWSNIQEDPGFGINTEIFVDINSKTITR